MGTDRSTTRPGSRGRRGLGAAIALAVVLGALAGLVPARAADAAAPDLTTWGSIVYAKGADLWLMSPDGAVQKQVTSDGNTPTADLTGNTGYGQPSQSDGGDVIVAIRNEGRTGAARLDGYVWVMNRQGQLMHKFPAPKGVVKGSGCGDRTFPRGTVDTAVSPDGTKVAFVTETVLNPGCLFPSPVALTQTWMANIDGTNMVEITKPDGNWDLAGPSWLTNSRLLMGGGRPGDIKMHFVDLPATVATAWDQSGREPDLKAGKLAKHGIHALGDYRLWLYTSNGPGTPTQFRCGYRATAGGFEATIYAPSWSPDAAALTWEERDEADDVIEPGEGIYAVAVGDLAAGCPDFSARRLLVPGGFQPDWGPAAMIPPTFSVNDISVTEGNTGTTTATFTVSRTQGNGTASVRWFTTDGTATAPGDYAAVSVRTLTFAAGELAKQVSVAVNGDTAIEANENLYVKLGGPSAGSTIADNTGRALIVNDDASAYFSVNDVSVAEGDAGAKAATFTITRSSAAGAVSVAWFTANNTATAPTDFTAVAATRISFADGETTKSVSVPVNGDTTVEPAEYFFVKLAAPSAGTAIADGTGRGTIANDDYSSTFSVDDVSVVEQFPGAGMVEVTFTVTRSGSGDASVGWATADGTAVAGSDYEPRSWPPLTWSGTDTTPRHVTIGIVTDWDVEPNESFFLKLSAPSAGTKIADGTGRAVIVNDDTA